MKTLHIKESPGGFDIMINGVLNRRVSRDEIEAIRPGLQALAFLLDYEIIDESAGK